MEAERETAIAVADPGAPTFECPECHEKFPKPEDLGVHLERHREVLPARTSVRGKSLTQPCPKGCGRNFRPGASTGCTPRAEIRTHIENCDGQPPIPADEPKVEERKEAEVAKLKCQWCGKSYKHPKRLESHEAECEKVGHTGETPSTRRRAKADDGDAGEKEPLVVVEKENGLSLKEKVINFLEVEEERLTSELGHCKAMIAAVRESGGGG